MIYIQKDTSHSAVGVTEAVRSSAGVSKAALQAAGSSQVCSSGTSPWNPGDTKKMTRLQPKYTAEKVHCN
jgi:hypothetical protein